MTSKRAGRRDRPASGTLYGETSAGTDRLAAAAALVTDWGSACGNLCNAVLDRGDHWRVKVGGWSKKPRAIGMAHGRE